MSAVAAEQRSLTTNTGVAAGQVAADVPDGKARRPRCRPSNRLERGIVLYLMRPEVDGSVVGEEAILRMLWDLSLLGGPLLPGASFQNIREPLHELATSRWIGIRLVNRNEPRRFWLVPGVGRYIDDPASAYRDETEAQYAAAIMLARARDLLPGLKEAPSGHISLVLSKSDALGSVSIELQIQLLGRLVERDGREDSSREAIATALGSSSPPVSQAIRWLQSEGYVARIPIPRRRNALETILLPAGCTYLIELLEAGTSS
jgi:hypothetical protein